MSLKYQLILFAVGLIIFGVIVYFLTRWFSPEAVRYRHRRKNYNRVSSNSKKPIVMLQTRVPKDRRGK